MSYKTHYNYKVGTCLKADCINRNEKMCSECIGIFSNYKTKKEKNQRNYNDVRSVYI